MKKFFINGVQINAEDLADAAKAHNALVQKSLHHEAIVYDAATGAVRHQTLQSGEELAPWGLTEDEVQVVVDHGAVTPEQLAGCINYSLSLNGAETEFVYRDE